MTDALLVEPLARPPDATVRLPGSKSITNRALVCAALADGESVLDGALVADDTEAMVGCLRALGAGVQVEDERTTVTGTGVRLADTAELDARLSGTTARFVLPIAGLGAGPCRVDGQPPLRRRPMGPTLDALRALGAAVAEEGEPGRLPVVVRGPIGGGDVSLPGDASSQFLSGLLLAGPAVPGGGLTVAVAGPLVSRPYVDMTVAVMAAFGARVDREGDRYRVLDAPYRPRTYRVEPDASAASYFAAAAAITGGRVRIEGLGRGSLQGDVGFLVVLERMGADVRWEDGAVEIRGTGRLRGVEVDLADLSDTAQTLAAVAVFAETPTRVTGIGFIRAKETDRVGAVVAELRRAGIDAEEEADGFLVRPGTPRPATIETYDDHRMAMSFALLGLRVPGIEIADPGCVAKTFPGFWRALDELRAQ